jgi:hypothetical protein
VAPLEAAAVAMGQSRNFHHTHRTRTLPAAT